jgi:hypothetical protein
MLSLQVGSRLLYMNDAGACPAPYAPNDTAVPIACMLEGYSSRMDANGTQARLA